jgi:hypothetical protein
MSNDFLQYVPRRPRYRATHRRPLRVTVQRSAEHQPAVISAELVDFSRSGFSLRLTVPVEAQEVITLQIREQESELYLAQSGTVQWQCCDGPEAWLIGCKTSLDLDWETLGELFLNEILSTEAPPRT